MKIAVVGYGVEGAASYAYFVRSGHEVTICDQSDDIKVPAGAQAQLGSTYLDNLDRFDLIVRTAGMHPKLILDKNPGMAGKVTTQLNEFLRVCPTKNIIGVTGTKGKGTTSSLIAKMLEAALRKHSGSKTSAAVHLGGNIGVPLFSFIDKLTPDSWVVLELSSFQLIDVQFSPHIGVCLMVVPEHLNWHENLGEYLFAKSQLFTHQSKEDFAIYLSGNEHSKWIADAGDGQKITFFAPPGAMVDNHAITIDGKEVCPVDQLKLLGPHNWQNACAAVTAIWYAGIHDIPAMRSVLTSFSGLEHRLEFVREIGGVRYYDDSFGTTPETATVAVQAFEQPKVLILGGSDKGVEFDGLAWEVARNNVRKVLLIGKMGPKIGAALKMQGFTNTMPGGKTMAEIVKNAREQAQPGDVVVLSTACASFDMFKDYKDRGDQFKKAVRALA